MSLLSVLSSIRTVRRVYLPLLLSAAVLLLSAVVSQASVLTVDLNTDSAATTTNPGDGPGQAGDLRSAMLNSNSGDTIQFNCGSPCIITLNGPLPPITHNLTINGGSLGNVIIDGSGNYRVFFVDTGTVQIKNLLIRNARAKGGDGGSGGYGCGGGGAGLGAGLFVNGVTGPATVTLTDVFFLGDSAVGGNGCAAGTSNTGGGGGGGLGGNGGNGEFAAIPNGSTNGGGGGVLGPGAAGGTTDLNGVAGGAGGGGGSSPNVGAGIPGSGGSGYGTNIGGGSGQDYNGGNGGFGGGGGGGSANGGAGGFGGGGGGGSANGGNGGPGGGGGGSIGSLASGGALVGAVAGGASASGSGGGGGGAAAGPDIFVNQGTLITNNSSSVGASATGGLGGSGGGNGGSDATPVFNYLGIVNGASTKGPIAGALTVSEVPTFVVTSTEDRGAGSLREALASADSVGAGNITFDPIVFATPQTITLQSTLNIPSNTTITGATSGSGATLTNLVTVSGGGPSSNFSIFTVGSGVTAAINNLVIANGYNNINGSANGGGISNAGSLTVTGSTFENNFAGGVPSAANGGGAIYSTNNLTVRNSTFIGNTSAPGGAINADDGTVTIDRSTFSGNAAVAGKAGGAIFINNATVTITASSFSGNSAAGGGAVFNNATLTAANTIMAGNTGGDCGNGGGSTCPTNGTNGNVIGVANIGLAPLGNYGGPTLTMIPLPGSPAICSGSQANIPSSVTTDQRGYPNTNPDYTGFSVGNPCVDAGAAQTNYALSFTTQPPLNTDVGISMSPAPAVTLTESGNAFAPGVTIPLTLTGSGTLSGGSATTSAGVATYSALQISKAGSNDQLTASLTLNSAPAVSISAVSSQFSVDAATPAITFAPSPATQTYGTAIAAGSLNATASYNGSIVAGTFAYTTTVNGNTVTLTPGTTVLPVGSYTITATFTPGTSSVYAGTSTTASYRVAPAALTITASSGSMTYGGTVPSITASYAGFVNVDSSVSLTTQPTCSTTATSNSAVGTYPSTCTGAVDANYTMNYTPGVVTVTGTRLTIAANNATKTYGTANPAFSGSVTGAVNGDTFTEGFSTTATISSPVGSYAIVSSVTGTNLADYTQSVTNGTLTVTKAPSTTSVSLSNATITPGENETVTATVASATTGTPTGTVSFYDGTTLLNTATLSSGTASYSTTTLATGVTHVISAVYSGDTNFTASSTATSTSITVASLDFNMTISGPANPSVIPGQSITYQATVTPLYGSYAGTVSFAVAGLPPGANVTFSPSSIPANGGPQTITVTIATAPAKAASRTPPRPSPMRREAPASLAFLVLFGMGAVRRRSRALQPLLCVVLLLIGGAAATLVSGCGGGGFFVQAPENYTVTVTATAGSIQHTAAVTLNVE